MLPLVDTYPSSRSYFFCLYLLPPRYLDHSNSACAGNKPRVGIDVMCNGEQVSRILVLLRALRNVGAKVGCLRLITQAFVSKQTSPCSTIRDYNILRRDC